MTTTELWQYPWVTEPSVWDADVSSPRMGTTHWVDTAGERNSPNKGTIDVNGRWDQTTTDPAI